MLTTVITLFRALRILEPYIKSTQEPPGRVGFRVWGLGFGVRG